MVKTKTKQSLRVSVSVTWGLVCLVPLSRTEFCVQEAISHRLLNDPCMDYCFRIWKLSREKMTS